MHNVAEAIQEVHLLQELQSVQELQQEQAVLQEVQQQLTDLLLLQEVQQVHVRAVLQEVQLVQEHHQVQEVHIVLQELRHKQADLRRAEQEQLLQEQKLVLLTAHTTMFIIPLQLITMDITMITTVIFT